MKTRPWIVLSAALVLFGSGPRAAGEPPALSWYQTELRLASAPAYMGSPAPITNVHERSHWVSNELTNRYGRGGRDACLYVGNGRFVRIAQPRPLRIAHVADRVRFRGRIFDLYLVQQRDYWDAEPLYLFDEWVCYSNGAATAVGSYPGYDNAYTVAQALEFSHYTAVTLDAVPANYDARPLAAFWLWNAARLEAIAKKARLQPGNWEPSADNWLHEMRRAAVRVRARYPGR